MMQQQTLVTATALPDDVLPVIVCGSVEVG